MSCPEPSFEAMDAITRSLSRRVSSTRVDDTKGAQLATEEKSYHQRKRAAENVWIEVLAWIIVGAILLIALV